MEFDELLDNLFKQYGWLRFKSMFSEMNLGYKKAFIYNKITKSYKNQQLDLFEYEPEIVFCEFNYSYNWYTIPYRKVINRFEMTTKIINDWNKLTLKELETLLQSIELDFKKFINELKLEKLEREFNE